MTDQQKDFDTKWIGAGLFAGFAASLCCVIPVAALLTGISGVASAFSWVEPFRPYLIGLTVLFLGFAWYQKLGPKWDSECTCEENPSFWNTKGSLGVVTILAALLLAFPYYSDAFFPKQNNQQVIYVQKNDIQTLILNIEGMTCTGCEATVENAASDVIGVLEVDASYDTGNATIKYDKSKTNLNQITATINKTGFIVKGKTKNSY